MTQQADNTIHVSIGEKGYTTEISANGHALIADEPKSAGGADKGPNPYALLLSALGACKAITLRMYADRKGWYLGGVNIDLRHERIHAKDCEECESESGQVDRIDVEIELLGELSDEQRQRLLEIADRCPVHRTLQSETTIKSALRA